MAKPRSRIGVSSKASAALVAGLVTLTGCRTASQDPAAPSRGALAEPAALTALDDASRSAVANAPVPVLLLPESWGEHARVTSGRGFYAISARQGEISVSVHATDVVHHRGDGRRVSPGEHRVRGEAARVQVNEGIRSVTWREGDVSYVVEVECYHAFEDARCTGDEFVLELANAMVEVGQ